MGSQLEHDQLSEEADSTTARSMKIVIAILVFLLFCLLLFGIVYFKLDGYHTILNDIGDNSNETDFSSYKKIKTKLEEHMLERVQNSFQFIFRVAGQKSSELFSFVSSDRFMILQLLYAFSEKDIVYSNFLLEVSDSFEIGNPGALSSWINNTLKFENDEVFEIIKYTAMGKENGMLSISKPLTYQLLLMNNKYPIFEHACSVGDTATVQWFLREGFDLRSVSWSLLEDTWNKGHLDVVKILLENNFLNKANLTQEEINKSVKNQTLLHVVARYGLVECAKELISLSADVNVKDDFGNTPLFSAVLAHQLDIIKVLVENGADMNVTDNSGEPLLHVAMSTNDPDVVTLLLDLGAPVDCKDEKGISPLFKAVELDNVQLTYELILRGADFINFVTNSGDSVLHEACAVGNLDTVKGLLKLGSIVDKKNRFEETPLYIAAKNMNLPIMEYLLTNGADLYIKDRKGRSLLHRAAFLGDIDVVDSLIKVGMPVDTKAADGTTALDHAAKEGFTDVARLLLKNGANPNASNEDEWTPLHRAVQWGFYDTVALLLDNGANPEVKSKTGWTPLALAQYYGHETIANLIVLQLGSENTDIHDRMLPNPPSL